MQNDQQRRRKRIGRRATVMGGLALAGLAVGGIAFGAAAKPSMQVHPSPKGLKYRQTVQVTAKNLPKGSGTIALTICGLHNAKGTKITPTANDCAGQDDISSGLVVLQQWKDGTFNQKYTLPKNGQRFGKNQRFCDTKHHCSLVVADANPEKPAYHVDTEIQFTDQKSTTPTTKPKPKPTPTTKPKPTTTTTQPDLSFAVGGSVNAGPSGGGSGGAKAAVNVPDGTTPPAAPPEVTVPAPVVDAVTQACGQVADAIKQGGGDASALKIACSTLVNGGGGAQLGLLLQSPSFACSQVTGAAQGNEQLAGACSQLATALKPYSSQLGDALSPVLGKLP